jgi:predicted RND superfamily exporter protein
MKLVFGWVLRHPLRGFLAAVAICILGIIPGSSIPIRLSLIDLLPEERESVRYSKELAKEVGGIGYLLVLVGPTVAPEQHLDKLAAEFGADERIRYTFHERETYSLRERALYTLSREDFDAVLSNSETLVFGGKIGGFLDLGLGDEDQDAARVRTAKAFFKDLKEKHGGDLENPDSQRARYFLSKDGRYAAFWMKPNFQAERIDLSTQLIEDVDARVHKIIPEVPFRLWGRYVNHAHDVKQIKKDIGLTGLVSTLAMLLVLYFGLGSIRSAAIAILSVVIAMGWALGFAQLFVGQINIITGFLLAILGGLGVEYGIHLIRRYYQERRLGKNAEEALETVYWTTGGALLAAALTSAGAFLILAISDFRAFSEMGLIAGFGILAIYVTYMLVFPYFCRWLPERPKFSRGIRFFGYYPFSTSWAWTIPVILAAAGFGLSRARFEYDFEKMRELSVETVQATVLVNEIMNSKSTTPIPVLAENSDQAYRAQRWLQGESRKDVIDSSVSLWNLVPRDMEERHRKLKKFADQLEDVSDLRLRSELGIDPKLVRSWVNAQPYGRADLPPQLRDTFGKDGNVLLVYSKVSLSNYPGIKKIIGTLLDAAKEFPGLKVGGDTRIFKEILDHIFHDGPKVMLLFLIGAFGLLFLEFRTVKDALQLELQLVVGIGMLVGIMGLLGVPFSIVNIGMIPAVLACGIDIGVHVRHREQESGSNSLESARFVAQAVQLSVLTTLIGFGSLFLADAGMLKGIAWISVIGQSTMYFICMFAWPVGRTINTSIRGKRSAKKQARQRALALQAGESGSETQPASTVTSDT